MKALVTGASSGIGWHFADLLAREGYDLVITARDTNRLNHLASEFSQKYGRSVEVISADLTTDNGIGLIESRLRNKDIDVLINNAHFIPRSHPRIDSPFEDYPFDLWQDTIETNLNSLFLCCKEFGKIMTKQRNGVIINISSIYGIVGADQRIYGKSKLNSPSFYAATKGAMVNLTRYLAAFWHDTNIRVNTLTLGGVYDSSLHKNKEFVKNYSEKTMIGRMARKDDYYGAIIFLASDASTYMTGSNLIIDGGWSAW